MTFEPLRSVFDASDFVREVWVRVKHEDQDLGDAMKAELVDLAMERLRPRITAAMRRAGLPIEDGEDLSEDTIRRAINERLGIEIEELTPDGIRAALDQRMAGEVSRLLGVDVSADDLADAETLRARLLDAVKDAVASGRANKLISRALIRSVRRAATWARAGVPAEDRGAILNRYYQKRYRRKHVQVWD